MNDAIAALSALAQGSRLQVFRMLVKIGPPGIAAGQIAEKLKIPPATLSFHLKELLHAGLVDSHKVGRSVIYSMNEQGINDLMAFLMEDCCQGRSELCAIPCCDSNHSPRPKVAKRKSAK